MEVDQLESLEKVVNSDSNALSVDDKGWVHIKYVLESDRTAGGTLVDENGIEREVGESPGWGIGEPGTGSRWRWNQVDGYLEFDIRIVESSIQGVEDCEPFEEPTTTTTTTTTTTSTS